MLPYLVAWNVKYPLRILFDRYKVTIYTFTKNKMEIKVKKLNCRINKRSEQRRKSRSQAWQYICSIEESLTLTILFHNNPRHRQLQITINMLTITSWGKINLNHHIKNVTNHMYWASSHDFIKHVIFCYTYHIYQNVIWFLEKF